MESFPSLIPAVKPSYNLNVVADDLSNYWISGYFSIYCFFDFDLTPHYISERGGLYNRAVPLFSFSRTGEAPLLNLLALYFEGNINFRGTRGVVTVYGVSNNWIPSLIFSKYPLSTLKQREFLIWTDMLNILIDHRSNRHGSFNSLMPVLQRKLDELHQARNSSDSFSTSKKGS